MSEDRQASGKGGTTSGRRFDSNPLFRPGPNISMNACVGDNGGPYDFGAYAQGFFESGFAAIEAAREYRAPLDVLIYPAVFSFRHGIELYIKHFLVELRNLGASEADYRKNHRLEQNWRALVEVAAATGYPEFTAKQIADAGTIIAMFCEIDPTGQVFRYPEDVKGNRHLTEVAIVNVEMLGRFMRALCEIFKDWERHIDVRWELRWEGG